jgi:lysyl-tRNA synthetase class 2
VRRYASVDLEACPDAASLRAAAERAGVRVGGGHGWDDVFFHLFLQKVEPKLGVERPTFLTEYPAAMASLSRLKPGDPSVAERVELYAGGFELANGFSELNDAVEQRKRLVDEQALRRREGRVVPPLDERFLAAVGKLPEATGIAIGMDRVLMLLLGEAQISDVLLFPAHEFIDD